MERLEDDGHSHAGGSAVPAAARRVFITGHHRFCSNKVSTAKYNFVSFLPKFLFEQFRRYSNTFFLFIALMQQIPGVSPTGRYTTAVPLIFILTVSALKEIFEDIKRHRADRGVNRSIALVLNTSTRLWEKKFWCDIAVGDIVKVMNEQFFPSDLLILSSSEPNGMCYVETANLDGETNLKIRQSLAVTYECVTSEKLVSDLSLAAIECDPPNKHLYEFHGTLKIDQTIVPITPDQILLRGAKLKNSNWIFGCVLYSGHETKLMMNSMIRSPLKQSKVEQLTNKHILSLFAILAVISAISTIASIIWNYTNNHWYLLEVEQLSNPIWTFLTFVILYNNLVPISLQVTLEVVRFFQAQFINSDMEMYDEVSDTPAMARTSNLNEELGQVRYILSDKTGTLTCNIMEFKQCTIAGKVYTEEQFQEIASIASDSAHKDHVLVRELLTLLSVCHTVVPELSSDSETGEIKYQAASPDEGALVKGAAKIGFRFTTRTPQYVFINAVGHEERYEVLNVLEFNSDRKRMSVVVRCPDGRIKIYVKGADTVINRRLSRTGQEFKAKTLEHLEDFASMGLRTLCCAFAVIPEPEYVAWNNKYLTAVSTSDSVVREKEVDAAMEAAESQLTLIGATAVEDKLQDGVPETIETLLKAGIRVWILTGDKKETAINIGSSCKLLVQGMPLIVLSEESLDATRAAVRAAEPNSKASLIIDGTTLRYAFASDVKSDLMHIALNCRSVICCRVSPIQKAEIVEQVKRITGQVTLAIGDGANDVAMIRAANVGVGISGQEGLQAAHSADYSISQFRFLTRLTLVHGSWSLNRLCKLILYSFYKNIALYVIELWFAIVSAWSGQTIFERWTIGFYNVFFTAAPPLVIGLFDRQCSAEIMLKYPSLYSNQGDLFSPRLFWIWVWSAILHSLTLFYLTYFMICEDALWSSGLSDGGYLVYGNTLYTYVVVTVCLKAGLELTSWTFFTHMAIWGSIALWFVFLVIYSRFWPTIPMAAEMTAIDHMLFTSLNFWAGLLLIPFMTLIVDIVYKIIIRTCYKTTADQIIDMESRAALTSPSSQTLLSETARLIRNVFDSTRRKKAATASAEEAEQDRSSRDAELELQHGYAFSQEEHGVVAQAQLIRVYDTTKAKPAGQ
jgi:phospholipid-transporting ATPase